MNEYQAFLVRSLRRGIEDADALIRVFPRDSLDREWTPGAWPVRRQAHHLRQIQGRYLDRLENTLAANGRVPAPVQHLQPDMEEAMESVLSGFVEAGNRAATMLEQLSESDWVRAFNHPTIWGDINVQWWAERFVQHTAEHLSELWMFQQLSGLTADAYERVRVQ